MMNEHKERPPGPVKVISRGYWSEKNSSVCIENILVSIGARWRDDVDVAMVTFGVLYWGLIEKMLENLFLYHLIMTWGDINKTPLVNIIAQSRKMGLNPAVIMIYPPRSHRFLHTGYQRSVPAKNGPIPIYPSIIWRGIWVNLGNSQW